MEFHEAANLFPLMSGTEFEELKTSISSLGLIEEITKFEGKILDGRNRYRACVEVGVEPRYKTYEGDDPVGHVIALNKSRRHLTASQLAAIAIEAEELYERLKHEAKENQKRKGSDFVPQQIGGQNNHSGEADQKLAEQFGTNREYIRTARNLKKDNPEAFDDIKKGKRSVSTVRRQITKKNKSQKSEPTANKKSEPKVTDLPGHLKSAFALIPQMERVIADIKQIKKWILANGRDGALSAQMEWASIQQNLGRSITLIENCIPYRPCPKCDGKGGLRSCLPCKGSGWVSKKTLNNLGEQK